MRVIYKRGPYAVRHVYDKSRRDRWAVIRPDEPRWRDNTRHTLDPEEAKRLLTQACEAGSRMACTHLTPFEVAPANRLLKSPVPQDR